MSDEAPLDRRRYAYRKDLAARGLEGRVTAKRYVDGVPYHVIETIAPVRPEPKEECDLDTEALAGEAVDVFDIADGWAWCQLAGDGYVGYLPADTLAEGAPARPTHRVKALATFAYAEPTARSRPTCTVLFGSSVAAVAERGDFIELKGGGFIGTRHAEPVGTSEPDYVGTAHLFLGTPYLWGGKSVRGIDCSGLVQLALTRAGIVCPRDTDMQLAELPGDIDFDGELTGLCRGDLVYWPRHVGIMIDATHIIHANGTTMSTIVEPVFEVAQRSRGDGPVATAVKRLGWATGKEAGK